MTQPTALSARKGNLDPRDTDSPFGVLAFLDWNHAWNSFMYDTPQKIARAVDVMADAGVKMVRQVVSWDEVESQQGTFNFGQYDAILEQLQRRGIRMLGVLCYTALCTGRPWNAAPNPSLFAAYVRHTVQRYKDRIRYWEVWNEPDQSLYWSEQDEMKSYTALLRGVHLAVKAEDPTAQVVLGSASSAPPIEQMYRQGARGSFDILNVHPFVSPLIPEAIHKVQAIYQEVRAIMANHDDADKPIWFTEMGCPGVSSSSGSKGWWQGISPTENQQADWLSQIYKEALAWPGVERIFWAFLQETQHFGDDIDHFGLMKRDFTPKPALAAYRRAAQTWASSSK